MNSQEIIKKLTSLVHLDADAARAYTHALDEIDEPAVHAQLVKFHDDHERHVLELSQAIRGLGGTPPQRTRDVKGYVIAGFTAIRSAMGPESALKALRSNEKLTNKTYANAITWELPPDIKGIVESNYRDEQHHLQYVEQSLSSRAWEVKTGTRT